MSPRGQELLRRARLAQELAGRAIEPPEPLPSGSADALACELYRESVEWSLAAHQEQKRVAERREGSPPVELPALWKAADPALLEKAAADEAERQRVLADISGKNFREFAELEATEQARLARALRQFADGLIRVLDETQVELDRLWLKRIIRIGLLLGAVIGLVVFASRGLAMSEDSKDLTKNAMWSASSFYTPDPGCPAPSQECASNPNYFIATGQEDNPWLMFDLKKPTRVSGIRVDNRIDCCQDRAMPLIVEVSDDTKSWKEIARRTEEFSSWRTDFTPVTTRYVRLRIPKTTNLNLSRVRLFP